METEHLFRSTALAVGLKPSAMRGEARLRGLERAVADYLLKDHKPSAMECKARLRGLYRIISSRTISPRLWNAKPACAGENRAPSFRNRRDAASGAHASGAHPGRDAPALQGLPRAQEGLMEIEK
jgi:hypothetical protein